MRNWTRAAMCGAAILTSAPAPSGAQVGSTTVPAPLVPLPTPPHGRDTLFLVKGDSFRVALRGTPRVHIGISSGRATGVRAQWQSDNVAIAAVDRSGYILAQSPGTTRIVGITAARRPAQADTLLVHVMSVRESSNRTAVAVCPNDDDPVFKRAGADSLLPLTEGIPDIHEYHDCQRLIADGHYWALIGIYAHRNVDTLQTWDKFQNGRLVATVVNFVGKKTPTRFPWLRLAPGTNCLVLKANSDTDWEAAVIEQTAPVVRPDGTHFYDTCADGLTWTDVPDTAKHQLQVLRQTGAYDYLHRPIAPPVARWDWDPDSARNYMGVKCTRSVWCEIGWQGFKPSTALKVGADEIIKGYYDEQFLANKDGSAPSTVFGTLQPGADLKDTSLMKHNVNKKYHVAQITLHETHFPPSSDYLRYFHGYHGPPAGLPTTLTTKATSHLTPVYLSTSTTRMYDGWFNGKPLNNSDLSDGVVYHKHPNRPQAAVVRWRWDLVDERTWSYCDPEGCCENTKMLAAP